MARKPAKRLSIDNLGAPEPLADTSLKAGAISPPSARQEPKAEAPKQQDPDRELVSVTIKLPKYAREMLRDIAYKQNRPFGRLLLQAAAAQYGEQMQREYGRTIAESDLEDQRKRNT